MAGVPSCRSAHQALKGAPWVGPYSVAQCLRRLMGQPPCLQLPMVACGEREATVMAPPPTRDSALSPCCRVCLAFLQAFPTTTSSLTSPRSIFPQSIAALELGLLHSPETPAPSLCPFQEICILARHMYGFGEDCLILIPFRLPQISYFTLSLKCFSSDSDNCPAVGIRPLLQFPHPLRAGPVLLTLLFFPLVPSSY